MHQPKLEFAHL